MLKKQLALILALCMATSVAGCGNSEKNAD